MNAASTNSTDLRAQLRELTGRTLSPVARYAHVGLLLVASGMGALIVALLLTEPDLPVRTQLAFGALLAVAASWIGYAAWVLTRRRPLLLQHRVVAGRLAIAFSGGFAAITAAAALVTGAPTARTASALGVLMLVTAVVLLLRAQRQRRALTARRDALMAELGEGD